MRTHTPETLATVSRKTAEKRNIFRCVTWKQAGKGGRGCERRGGCSCMSPVANAPSRMLVVTRSHAAARRITRRRPDAATARGLPPTGSVVMCAVCAFTRAAPAPMTACWGGAVGHPTHPPCANRRTAFRRPEGANPILYSDSGRNAIYDPVERLAGACMPTCRQNAGIVARESRVRNGAPECEERHGEDMMNAEPSAEKPLRKKYFSVCHLKASRERWAGMLRGKGALMGSRHAAPKACGERSLSRRGSRPVMKPMLTWMRSVRPAVPDKRGSCPPPSPAPEMRRFAASIDGMGTMSRFRLGRHRERASTQWDGVHIRCRHESHPGCMEMIGCEGIVRRCRVRRRVSGLHPVSCKSGLDAGANMRTGCRGHGKQDWKQPRKKYFQVCHLKASREGWTGLREQRQGTFAADSAYSDGASSLVPWSCIRHRWGSRLRGV